MNNERKRAWYVVIPDNGIEEHDTADAAKKSADGWLDHFHGNAPLDGWPDGIDHLEWGEMVPRETARIEATPTPEGFPFDECVEVTLEPVADPRDERIAELERELSIMRNEVIAWQGLSESAEKECEQLKCENAVLRAGVKTIDLYLAHEGNIEADWKAWNAAVELCRKREDE